MADTSLLARWDPAPGPESRRTRREGAGGRVVLVLVLVLALLVGGGYAAAYVVARDKLPRGTTVAGVDVGGLTTERAVQVLATELAGPTQQPIPVEVDGQVRSISPGMAGLAVDYEASVASVHAGHSWNPQRLWAHYTDGPEVAAVVRLDPTRMSAALRDLAGRVDRPARNGAVFFTDSGVTVRRPVTGHALDPTVAQDALVAAYTAQVAGDRTGEEALAPVVLPTRDVRPVIDDSDVERAVKTFADPALSGPVTLKFEREAVDLRTREVLPMISFQPQGGRLVPEADEQLLLSRVGPDVLVGRAPVDADVALVDGRPQVVPSVPGTRYVGPDIAATLIRLLAARDGQRAGAVRSRPQAAAFGDKQARALRVREVVATVTTPAPATLDLTNAAAVVDGTLLKPGDGLSLRDLLGGRVLAPAATEQLASTLYDASLSAGLDVLERHAPSSYVARLPLGRDAVVTDTEDLQVSNTSRHGVLVSATGGAGTLTVTVWSTADFDVDVTTTAPYDVVQPGARGEDGPRCVPRVGRAGFTVDVTRSFRRPDRDAVVRQDITTTSYPSVEGVICVTPPTPPAAPTPQVEPRR